MAESSQYEFESMCLSNASILYNVYKGRCMHSGKPVNSEMNNEKVMPAHHLLFIFLCYATKVSLYVNPMQ